MPASVVTLIRPNTSALLAFLKLIVGVSSTAIVISPDDSVPANVALPVFVSNIRAFTPAVSSLIKKSPWLPLILRYY